MSNYPREILDNIINSDYLLLKESACPPTKFLNPLFSSDLSNRKRILQDFLDEFYKKPRITITLDSEDEVEDNTPPENSNALSKLRFNLDPLFRLQLKSHQVEGVQFMWDRVFVKKRGCLLAHSMGLGKTIQVISLLTTMYQYLQAKPTNDIPRGKRVLILAPLVTLTNWVNEFEKWAVNDVQTLIGEVYNISEIGHSKSERLKFLTYWYTQGGVLLMNYDLFRGLLCTSNSNDQNKFYDLLVNPGPDVVILDEAHRIKNSSSLLASYVNKIRTRTRICMTGYPLQNRLLEYYYMINFIAPGLLGSTARFKAYFSMYIDRCYSDSSLHVKEQAAFKLYVLQLLTANVTHRRDGSILEKQLPSKTEYLVRFKLSPVQHIGYTFLLKSGFAHTPLTSLFVLRSMCNHPKIFHKFMARRSKLKRDDELNRLDPEEEVESVIVSDLVEEDVKEDGEVVAESFKVIKEVLDSDLTEDNEEAVFSKFLDANFSWIDEYLDNKDIESWKCSGKMSFIVDLIKESKAMGEKVVIVSHSLACLDYIQDLLPVFGVRSSRLDGSVVAMDRQIIIDTFNDDNDIHAILLSAKAAAIGINVTAANRIVLVDQDWNPLYDEQSIGRVYRYGQTKPVTVYRLITASTIEERIYMQSVHKRSISKRVIDNKIATVISREDLVAYFQAPDADLGLIDMNKVDKKDVDWVTMGVLNKNTDTISSFKNYDDDIDAKGSKGMPSLSLELRKSAQKDANKLFREWKCLGKSNK
ncbi:P-loop containing nucleoside triphosphate hydrolase protein [Mucor mucedo]|uniref:P-loop containing nucleoside triphosphate hydrolase protein n=1 Tax=Mucor mucedo TaxID=29922 RepID=UPI00222100BE|nr:P-loop containing nucleoside triphosphate hydrolase protein [Mucor mucedo]KAI7868692.1 P-loop containing nucleoside triphosphate hydrolase protein [Mucor mucedo]